jgi:hypothetical protein
LKSQIDLRKSLRPPQFGLRTLLALVTACAALFALAQWLPPAAIVLLAFFALSIFCHVAGNAVGTRLRQIGDTNDRTPCDHNLLVRPQPRDFAPATHLSRRQSLGWITVIATSVGIASGAIGGGLWTIAAGQGPVGITNIAVGVIAFAVLGGLAAFATVGFAQVLLGAIWQALSAPPALPPSDSAVE